MPATPPADRQSITLWALTLDQRVPADIRPRVPAILHRIGADDAAGLAWAMGSAGPAEALRRLLAGRRCYVALVSGPAVAHAWVTLDGGEEEIGEVGMRLRLAPRDAYIWDCVTTVPYRRQLLFTALLAHVAAELSAEGYTRVWIGAGTDNEASRRGIARAGFQPVANVLATASGGPGGVQLAEVRGVPGAPEHLVGAARTAFGAAVASEQDAVRAPALRAVCRGEHTPS